MMSTPRKRIQIVDSKQRLTVDSSLKTLKIRLQTAMMMTWPATRINPRRKLTMKILMMRRMELRRRRRSHWTLIKQVDRVFIVLLLHPWNQDTLAIRNDRRYQRPAELQDPNTKHQRLVVMSSRRGGDVKQKGKHEPYAYVAFQTNQKERRERHK